MGEGGGRKGERYMHYTITFTCVRVPSLVPSPHVPPGEKRSGELS